MTNFLDSFGSAVSQIGDLTGLDDAVHDFASAFSDNGEDDSIIVDLMQGFRGATGVGLSAPRALWNMVGNPVLTGMEAGQHYATSTAGYLSALGHSDALTFGGTWGESWQEPGESFGDYSSRVAGKTLGGNWDDGLSLGEVSASGLSGINPLNLDNAERDRLFRNPGAPWKVVSGGNDLISGSILDPTNLLPGAGKVARGAIAGKELVADGVPRLKGAWKMDTADFSSRLAAAVDDDGTALAQHLDWLAESDYAMILRSREATRSGDADLFAYFMGNAKTRAEVKDAYTLLARLGDDAEVAAAKDRLVAAVTARGGASADELAYVAERIQTGHNIVTDGGIITDDVVNSRLGNVLSHHLTSENGSLSRAYKQAAEKAASNRVATVTRAPGTSQWMKSTQAQATRKTSRYRAFNEPEVTTYQPTRFHPIVAVVDFFSRERASGYISFHDTDSVNEIAAMVDDLDAVTRGAMRGGEGRAWVNAYGAARNETDRMRIALGLEERGFVLMAEARGISPEAAKSMWQASFQRRANAISQHREKGFISFLKDADPVVMKIPLLERQAANSIPLVDFREVSSALARHEAGVLEASFRTGGRLAEGALDVVNDIFKMSVLFRLGYTIRNLTEAGLSLAASGYLGAVVATAGRESAKVWLQNRGRDGKRLADKVGVATGRRLDEQVAAESMNNALAEVRVREGILDAVRHRLERADVNVTPAEAALLRQYRTESGSATMSLSMKQVKQAQEIEERIRRSAILRSELSRRITYHATDRGTITEIEGDYIDTTPSRGVAEGKADGVYTTISWESVNRIPFSFASRKVANPNAFAEPAFPGGAAAMHGSPHSGIDYGFKPERVRGNGSLVGEGLYTTDNRNTAHGYVNSSMWTSGDDLADWMRLPQESIDRGAVYEVKWASRRPPKVADVEDPGYRGDLMQEIRQDVRGMIPRDDEEVRTALKNAIAGWMDEADYADPYLTATLLEVIDDADLYDSLVMIRGEHADFARNLSEVYAYHSHEWWSQVSDAATAFTREVHYYWDDLVEGMTPYVDEDLRAKFKAVLGEAIDGYYGDGFFRPRAMLNGTNTLNGPSFMTDTVIHDRLGYDVLQHSHDRPGFGPDTRYVWLSRDPSELKFRKLDRNKTTTVTNRQKIISGYHAMLSEAEEAAKTGKVVEIRRGTTWRVASAEELRDLRLRKYRKGDERAIVRFRDPEAKPATVEVASYGEELDLTNLAHWPEDLKDRLNVRTRGDRKTAQKRANKPSYSSWVREQKWNDPEVAAALTAYARENGYGRIILPDAGWGQTVRLIKDTVEGYGGDGARAVARRHVDNMIAEAEGKGHVSVIPRARTAKENRKARRDLRARRRLGSQRERVNGVPVRPRYDQEYVESLLAGGAPSAISKALDDLAQARAQAEFFRTQHAEAVRRRTRIGNRAVNGVQDRVVYTDHGPVTVPGAFAGAQGEIMYRLTHSDSTIDRLVGDGQTVITQGLGSAVPTKIRPEEPRYFEAWANVLNWHWRDPSSGRLDPLVGRLVDGEDPSSLLAWLSTDEGLAYADNLGWNQSQFPEIVSALASATKMYLPDEEVVNLWRVGQLDATTLAERYGDRTDLPELNGLLVPQSREYADYNAAQQLTMRGTRKMFHYLGALPETTFARHPLYRAVYDQEMRKAVQRAASQKGEALTLAEIEDIAKVKREYARKVVNKTLFTISRRTGAATDLRFIAPFYAAWENVLKRWFGFAVNKTENLAPMASQGLRVINNATLINSETGEAVDIGDVPLEQTSMILPFKVDGYDMRTPLASMDVIFQGQPLNPGVGPFVALPLVKVLEAQPRAEDVLSWAFPAGIPRSAEDVFLSASLRRLKSRITEDQSFVNDANRIAMMEYIRYERGERRDLPKWSEIRDKTQKFYSMRMLTNLSAPFAVQYTNEVNYYVEELRRFKDLYGQDEGEQKFLEARPEAFVVLEPLSDNRSGVRSTYEAVENLKKYGDLAAEADAAGDPQMLGWLANYGQGEYESEDFSEAAYNWQLANSPVPGAETYRTRKNPTEIYSASQIRKGWIEFRKFMDTAESKLTQMGMDPGSPQGQEVLASMRRTYSGWAKDRNTEWYQDYVTTDRSKFDRRVAFFEEVLSDPTFMRDHADDPTIRSIATFLDLRAQMGQVLTAVKGSGGSLRLSAKSNAALSSVYNAQVSRLKAESVGFADFYDRYFTNDPVIL